MVVVARFLVAPPGGPTAGELERQHDGTRPDQDGRPQTDRDREGRGERQRRSGTFRWRREEEKGQLS